MMFGLDIFIQGVINDFGAGVIAGYSVSIKLNNLVITSFTTLGNGISNYTAQNMGANILPRIVNGFKAGIKIVWILCIPIVLLYLLAGSQLVGFFMNEPSKTALNSGIQFLHIIVPFFFIISVKLVADGILRGAEMMKHFMITTFTDLILRVLLAFVFAGYFGAVGILYAWSVGWIIGTILSVVFYMNGPWKKVNKNRPPGASL